jgi:2-polyprenyl-3-methyl-5-hydroxy-6-metoxy-1,4-benzoquinol methylase
MTESQQDHQRGLELFGQNRYAESVYWFTCALGKEETSERWNDWATAQASGGNPSEAESGFRHALRLDPDDAVALINLGTLLALAGRQKEAWPLLAKGINRLAGEARGNAIRSLATCLRLPSHLGGHEGVTHLDAGVLRFLIDKYHIRTFLDVGCGPGGMVRLARENGLAARGIDGDPLVSMLSGLGSDELIEHDFSAGPVALEQDFDLAWSVEFLEHVDPQFQANYLSAFRRAKFVFCTAAPPGKPGHHHVNCQPEAYWQAVFASAGFVFDPATTAQLREVSTMPREFIRESGMFFVRREVQTERSGIEVPAATSIRPEHPGTPNAGPGTAVVPSPSLPIHAVALATTFRCLDNYADLLHRIQGAGGAAEVIALPWTGDPSHHEMDNLSFSTPVVRAIDELSPTGISEKALEEILHEALRERPDLLFLGDVQSYPSTAIHGLLKKMDRPPLCIGFQHGLYQSWWTYNRNFCCDFLFCFGNRHVQQLKPELRPRAVPVGLPKLDRLRGIDCPNRGFILFVPQKFPEPETVCAALARYEVLRGLPVVVHDHPQHPGRYPFRSALAHKLPPGIDGAGDLIPLMAQCDTVITAHSTAGVEALYLGKPVVLLPNHGLTAFDKYPGIACDFSAFEIEAARSRAMTETESVAAFLEDVVGGVRFDHTDRALSAVRALLDRRAGTRRYYFGMDAAVSQEPALPNARLDAVLEKLGAVETAIAKRNQDTVANITAELRELLGPVGGDHRRKTYERRILFELLQRLELGMGDVMSLANRMLPLEPAGVQVVTEHPVAAASLDHQQPLGTAQDNTRGVGFCVACEELLGPKLKMVDLGCAGGGIVLDFTLRGHLAVGLDGSDYSKRIGRAAWRLLTDRLFTADLTKPYRLLGAGSRPILFDVVSCWEVLEHIAEEDLPQFLENVRTHLRPGGIFAGSIALSVSPYHLCVKPRAWWEDWLHRNFEAMPFPFRPQQLPRGMMTGLFDSADYFADPGRGLHFCVRQPGGTR